MNTLMKIDILIFSMMMLALLLVYYLVNAPWREKTTRVFALVLVFSMISIAADILVFVSADMSEPWARFFEYWANVVFMLAGNLPIIAWVTYFDYKVTGDIDAAMYRRRFYMITLYVAAAMLIVNHFTGFVFTIESDGRHLVRFGVYILMALIYVLMLIAFFVLRKIKGYVPGNIMRATFILMLLPIGTAIVQTLFNGIALFWPAMSLTAIMVFLLVEKDTLHKDALTLLQTRGQFETRIIVMMEHNEPFTLIMVDLDQFKNVNDTYGHDEGDDMLVIVASILEESVKYTDTVYRYGGDEFMLLIESKNPKAGALVRQRIDMLLELFNSKKVKPYRIQMSMGGEYFCEFDRIDLSQVLAVVDMKMYADKARKAGGTKA